MSTAAGIGDDDVDDDDIKSIDVCESVFLTRCRLVVVVGGGDSVLATDDVGSRVAYMERAERRSLRRICVDEPTAAVVAAVFIV